MSEGKRVYMVGNFLQIGREKMKAILVDDERLALEFLSNQLEKIQEINIIGKYTFFDLDKERALLDEVHVIFLDIEMPEKSGIQLAEQILEINSKIEIVFVTAYDKYAVDAFELHALDYLLKPVRVERLKKTVDRIKQSRSIALHHSTENGIYITLSGEFKIDDEIIRWRTSRAQELFLYLLHNAGKVIQKSTIVELLWNDFSVDRAYAQLYTTIYHIRKALRKFEAYLVLKNIQDGYLLETKNVKIDIIEWENNLRNAPPIDERTIEFHDELMETMASSYLQPYDYVWAEAERFRLEQLWLNHAKRLALWTTDNEQYDEAIKWYTKISDLRPDNEEIHFALMRLYAKLQYGLLVHHQYKRLRQYAEELNVEVSEQIQAWYQEFQQQA